MLLLFWACAKPCELDLLQQAQTTADISAACHFPSPEKRKLSCGDGAPTSDYDGLYALHDSCKLNDIASVDEFALSQGDPLLAAWSYQWMQSKSISPTNHSAASETSRVATAFRAIWREAWRVAFDSRSFWMMSSSRSRAESYPET